MPRAVTRFNKRFTNKLLIHLAGHSSFVELEHVGRTSGRVYRTPINAFPGENGSVVSAALPYGAKVDWYRNVRAAGGCRMRMKGDLLTLGPPRLLSAAEGRRRMPSAAQLVLRVANVESFVELPVLSRRPFTGWS